MRIPVLLCLVSILITTSVAFSQPGLTISGELTDTSGVLVGDTQTVTADVVVNIYDDENGTDPVYTESFISLNSQGIPVYKGNMSITIGRNDTLQTLRTILESSDNLWLEVIVNEDVLSRTPITASPYTITNNLQPQVRDTTAEEKRK